MDVNFCGLTKNHTLTCQIAWRNWKRQLQISVKNRGRVNNQVLLFWLRLHKLETKKCHQTNKLIFPNWFVTLVAGFAVNFPLRYFPVKIDRFSTVMMQKLSIFRQISANRNSEKLIKFQVIWDSIQESFSKQRIRLCQDAPGSYAVATVSRTD